MQKARARRLPVYRPGVKMVKLSIQELSWIGFVFVCLSSFSVAVLQNGILHLNTEGALEALDEAMKPGGQAMGWATGAVLCSLAATLAIPIFAKAVYEGWKCSADSRRYLAGLGICAVVSEIPYDFAMSGTLLDWSTQNPVWGLLLAAAALEITRYWKPQHTIYRVLSRVLIVFAALAWTLLLRVYMGPMLVLLVTLFCFAEKRQAIAILGGVLLTLLQFPAPIGMAFVNWYDAEKTEKSGSSGKLPAILYPIQLLAFGLLGMLIG